MNDYTDTAQTDQRFPRLALEHVLSLFQQCREKIVTMGLLRILILAFIWLLIFIRVQFSLSISIVLLACMIFYILLEVANARFRIRLAGRIVRKMEYELMRRKDLEEKAQELIRHLRNEMRFEAEAKTDVE